MKAQNISAQNFNGRLFVINKLSKKPAQSIEKEKSNLLNLIKKENFDLYIKQNYSNNKINIIATTKLQPQINAVAEIPVNSKHSAYLEKGKKVIQDYKTGQENFLWNEYKKKRTFKEKIFNTINKILYVLS